MKEKLIKYKEHQGLVPVSFYGKISYGIIQRAATDQRSL